jgi:transcriptional regulator with XRE-family HTH domain
VIDIGARIKHLRQINGLAQADLAERAGLTKGAISQIERNLTSPSVANLFEILSALNETPSSVFADCGRERSSPKTDALPSELPDTRRRYAPAETATAPSSLIAPRSPRRQTPGAPPRKGNYVLVLSGRLGCSS